MIDFSKLPVIDKKNTCQLYLYKKYATFKKPVLTTFQI